MAVLAALAVLAVCLANIVVSHYCGQLLLWPATIVASYYCGQLLLWSSTIVGKLQPQTLIFSAMYSFFRGEAESGLRFEF